MENRKLKYSKYIKQIRSLAGILSLLEKTDNAEEKPPEPKKMKWKIVDITNPAHNPSSFMASFQKMKREDDGLFFKHTSMTPKCFDVLLSYFQPHIAKKSTSDAATPECRLAILLMHLSQGASIQSLATSFKFSEEIVRSIVLEGSEIVMNVVFPSFVPEPKEDDYKAIERDFWSMWNIPNCVGAINGRHISIKCPDSESDVSNIVLMAACDAKYRFTSVDVGAYGDSNDGGVFKASLFGKKLLNKSLPIPPPKNLPNSEVCVPHYFVADAACPLAPNIMRMYSGIALSEEKEHFNRMLSRGCRTIENAFGVLVSRWKILSTTLHMSPSDAEKIALACVALHNFVMLNEEDAATYVPHMFADWEDSRGEVRDGLWRTEIAGNLPAIAPSPSTHVYGGVLSIKMRDSICSFVKDN